MVVTEIPNPAIPYSLLLPSDSHHGYIYNARYSYIYHILSKVVNSPWNCDAASLGRMNDNSAPTSVTCDTE